MIEEFEGFNEEISKLGVKETTGVIELGEGIRGFWFLGTADKNILTSIVETDEHYTITYRMRIYVDDKAFDSEDIKVFRSVDVPKNRFKMRETIDHVEAFYAKLRHLSKKAGQKILEDYTLLRGAAKLDDFMEEFGKLPFVHMKKVSKEEAEARGLDVVD